MMTTNPYPGAPAFVLQLDGGGRATLLGPAADASSAPRSDGPIWAHYQVVVDDAAPLIEREGLDEPIAEALVADGARPRASRTPAGLLAVLRGVNLNPGAEPEDMVSVRFWVEGDRIVTVSPRLVCAIDDVRDELDRGEGPTTAIGVFVRIATSLAECMSPVISALDDRFDDLHEQLLSGGPPEMQRGLTQLRHKVTLLRRHLAPQRDVAVRLYRDAGGMFGEGEIAELREVADRAMRHVEELDSIRERASVLQDEASHMVSMRLNRNMYVMSVIAAVFLPLSLVTGLLGINVGGIPGSQSPLGFWVVCGGLVLMGLFEFWLLRRARVL